MRLTRWIVGALAVALLASMFLPFVGGGVFVLAVPVAVAASLLTQRPRRGDGDGAARLVAAAAKLSGEPRDWGAALRAELATITGRGERRRFAIGAAVALLGRPRARLSLLVAAGVAVGFGTGLLGVSRAGLGADGLGTVTSFIPPLMLFAVAYLCARSAHSLRFGLETGLVAALTTLVAVAVVYGIEAVHWYHVDPAFSVLDGDYVAYASARAAVLDTAHPIILAVHLVFWLPWPLLGALAGARASRPSTS